MSVCPRCGQVIRGDWALLSGEPHHFSCAIEAALEALRSLGESALAFKNVVAAKVGFKLKRGAVTREICIVFDVERKLPLEKLKEIDIIPNYDKKSQD